MTPRDEPATILHVEDEELNRALLRAMLARAPDQRLRDAELREATNLAEARAILHGQSVDLVLLDVRLPDGNGLDLVHEIKAADREVGIVVMSASVLPGERERALETGCDAFMGKPYVAADLLATVRRFLPAGPRDRGDRPG